MSKELVNAADMERFHVKSGKQWDHSPVIRKFKARHGFKDNAAFQAYFNQRLAKILNKHGKQMVGWEEILNPALPKQSVVQS